MKLNYKNHKNAWLYFYPEGKGKAKRGHVLHHIDTTFRHNDPERYNEWRIEDLVMMTNKEHMSLHFKDIPRGALSKETKQKISKALKGTHLSYETKQKISLAKKGHNVSNKTALKISLAKKGIPTPLTSGHLNGMARKVLCVTTGEVFDCIAYATKKYPQTTKITCCCQGKRNYTGKLPDGTKLVWRYV